MAFVQLGGNQSDVVVKLKFWHPVVQKCLSLLVSAIEGCKVNFMDHMCSSNVSQLRLEIEGLGRGKLLKKVIFLKFR